MIKIKQSSRDGTREWHQDLSDWATNQLTSSDCDGKLEDLHAQVNKVARACAMLAERLVNTGQMSTKEFLSVITPYEWPEPEFVQVEETK